MIRQVDGVEIHSPTFVLGSLICLGIVYALYRRFNRISIAHIPGPEPESFIFGNLPELFQSQVGVPDFKWQSEYGGIARIRGAFGEDRLLVSDPKAMQYIFQTSGYGFLKWWELVVFIKDKGSRRP
ncbi:hypothetical protein MPER_08189 [Moniliophthora perniciosa FA553]|nr:hypothetical protein MPER_08189 [Moniliophthora perniciosa FA553]